MSFIITCVIVNALDVAMQFLCRFRNPYGGLTMKFLLSDPLSSLAVLKVIVCLVMIK